MVPISSPWRGEKVERPARDRGNNYQSAAAATARGAGILGTAQEYPQSLRMGNASSAAAMEEGSSQLAGSGNVAVTTGGSSSNTKTEQGAPSFAAATIATKTPAHRGHRDVQQPQPGHVKVTTEKKTGKASKPTKFSITCPDNKVVQLSPTSSRLLLGRGQHGVPASVAHVSRQACVIRLVRFPADGDDDNEPNYHLEMTVIGSQNCVVTGRSNKSIAVKNISAILKAGDNDTSPSAVRLNDGDVIEPYDRPVDLCSVDEAKRQNNTYFGYTVTISEGAGEGDKDAAAADGASFVEASRKIDQAVAERGNMVETQAFPRPKRTEDVEMAEANGQTGDSAEGIPGESVPGGTADAVEQMSAVDASRREAGVNVEVTGRLGMEVIFDSDIEGALIVCIHPDCGIRDKVEVGDRILTCNGVKVRRLLDLSTGDQPRVLTVVQSSKDGRVKTVSVAGKLGLRIKSDGVDGLEVRHIHETCGFKDRVSLGDRIVAADGRAVSTVDDLSASEGAARVLVIVSGKDDLAATASGDHTMMEVEAPQVDAPSRKTAGGNDKTDSSEESEEEDYDFDDPRQEIIDILEGIESPGKFAVGGCCGTRLLMPGLVVDGVGRIGLPLSETQAKELANRCEQAPFGRGEKTLVDKAVRNTFQLAPEYVQITNPSWSSQLAELTKEVCGTLGVQSNLTVEAKLYKMLLYEKGSHFKPHRDSEKEHGMFGTMVIVLPSHFTGGELVVKHKGEVETFDQSSVFSSHYAALYADCRHELKEVTSGHRLCLVYNLVKTGAGERPVVSDNVSTIKRLKVRALRSHFGRTMQPHSSSRHVNADNRPLLMRGRHRSTPRSC